MKKLLVLILLTASCMLMFSCFGTGGGDPNGPPENPPADGNYIYSGESDLYLVTPGGFSPETATLVADAIYQARGVTPKRRIDTSVEPQAHEIVLGDTEREISALAKDVLESSSYDDDTAAYVIYSDAKSIAVVWNNRLGMENGINALITEVLKEGTLALKNNYLLTDTASIAAREAELWEAELKKLATKFDGEALEAVKRLFSFYGDHLYEYIAALYDPATGGFYYSNSARDNEPFRTDIESTSRVLGFLTRSGMFNSYAGGYGEALDAGMREKLGNYIRDMQDPDGYFYHAQWGKDINTARRGRDLSNASDILKNLGVAPKYKLATDQIEDGTELVAAQITRPLGYRASTAVSFVIAADEENNVPDYLSSREKFIEYLDSLDFENDSYTSGHQLSATSKQIKAAGLGPVAVEYLDKLQNPENGFWEAEVNYESLSGFLKISSSYQSFGGYLNYLDVAAESILSMIYDDSNPRQIAQVYNLTNSLSNLLRNLDRQGNVELIKSVRQNLKENAARIATKLYEKLSIFLREDRTFSYYPDRSSGMSQGCPVALECREGCMGGLAMLSGSIAGFFSIMDATDVMPRIYTDYDLERFNNTIANASEIVKIELPPPEVMTMEDGVLPTYITGTLRSPGAEMGVTNDDRADSKHTAYITSYPDQGDYFKVSVAGTTATAHTALIAEADMRIASCLTTGSALQIALEDVYMISANVTADGTISFSELTATSGEDRYTTSLNAKAKVGEWFKLRIEYYVGDADSVRIKVFFNGTHIHTSKNFYGRSPALDATGEQQTPPTTFDIFRVYCMKSASLTTHIDNIFVDRSADVYDGQGEPEETPDVPVVEDFEQEKPSSRFDYRLTSTGASGTVVADPRGEGHVFRLVTKPELADNVSLAPGGLTEAKNPSCYITEIDVAFENVASEKVACRIVSGNYFSIDVAFTADGVSFAKRGETNYFAHAAYGEFVKIRVENYASLGTYGTVKVYVNGELALIDSATSVAPALTQLQVATLKAADHTTYVDNMFIDSTADKLPDEGTEDDNDPIIGEGIDFNSSTTVPDVFTTSFKSTGAGLYVIKDSREGRGGNVLMFTTSSGAMDKVIVSSGNQNGKVHVLDFDMMHAEGDQTGGLGRITFGNVYNLAIRHDKDMTLTFTKNGDNNTKYSTLARGTWFNLRIEITELGGDNFGIKVYLDGTLMAEDNVTVADAVFDTVTFSSLSKANHITYLDDIVIESKDASAS